MLLGLSENLRASTPAVHKAKRYDQYTAVPAQALKLKGK